LLLLQSQNRPQLAVEDLDWLLRTDAGGGWMSSTQRFTADRRAQRDFSAHKLLVLAPGHNGGLAGCVSVFAIERKGGGGSPQRVTAL